MDPAVPLLEIFTKPEDVAHLLNNLWQAKLQLSAFCVAGSSIFILFLKHKSVQFKTYAIVNVCNQNFNEAIQ